MANRKLDYNKIQELYYSGMNAGQIAAKLGYNYFSVHTALRRMAEQPENDEDDTELLVSEEVLASARSDIDMISDLVGTEKSAFNLRRKHLLLRKKYGVALNEIDNLQSKIDIFRAIRRHKISSMKISQPSKHQTKVTAVLNLSDWHIEEEVDPQTVNGVNAYNIDIAGKRVKRLFNSAMKLINIQRSGGAIDDLLLVINGDIISGYLHDGDEETNALSSTEAIIVAYDYLVNGIDFLLNNGKFKNINVVCKIGNHGRDTKRIRIKTDHKHSYEMILYEMLRKKYETESNMSWQLTKALYDIVDIYGYKLRIHHGATIRYRGGVGGLYIPVNKKIALWNRTFKVDCDVMGHFHQLIDAGNFVVNGSLIGYNKFSDSFGFSFEPPKQMIFFIDSKRGKTMMNPIYVDD